MTVSVLTQDYSAKKINAVATHPLQSWQWGEARKKMGIEVVRLGEFNGDHLQNIFQTTFHKIPHSPFTIGYLPRSAVPSQKILELLKAEARKRNAICVKLEPNVAKSNEKTINLPKAQHSLFPQWTQRLDLLQSEETLLAHLKPKTRYNMRLAEKKGVVVKEMTTEEGFEIFAQLYFETTARQRYSGHTKEYHKIIFETLRGTMSHILIAFYQKIPLSAYHLFMFNKVLYYPYGGSSLEHKNLMASNLLMWRAIQFGKQHGCATFDMWGSLPPEYDATTPWGGFTRFKEGFGTEFFEFAGSYDVVLRPFAYSAFNAAQSFRKKFLL
ncbi:MAG: Lipid II:glycine glycyltransferase [Microgenomates bacterium OLB23]|nr:MAG: Lipid II:glycine glycyltransferase [Microgenomates bacterium OLB23]